MGIKATIFFPVRYLIMILNSYSYLTLKAAPSCRIMVLTKMQKLKLELIM